MLKCTPFSQGSYIFETICVLWLNYDPLLCPLTFAAPQTLEGKNECFFGKVKSICCKFKQYQTSFSMTSACILCLWFTYAVTLWLMATMRCWMVGLDMPDAILWWLSHFKMTGEPPQGWISPSAITCTIFFSVHPYTNKKSCKPACYLPVFKFI